MRQSRFSDEQIVGILQEHAAGERPGVLCRRHGLVNPSRPLVIPQAPRTEPQLGSCRQSTASRGEP